MKKNYLFAFCAMLFSITVDAQPNLGLSLNEFLTWQPSAAYAENISNIPLAKRAKYPNHQILQGLDTNTRVMYAPDGMNNFSGGYIDSSTRFNHFNFTHWQYIDVLAWFGGTAGMPVMIPTKPWVDAAHANGVKVIGCVFLAPQAWGGSENTVIGMMEKDSITGKFIASNQLIAMTNYFNIDGWLLNFETDVSSGTAQLVMDFVKELNDSIDGDIIWYDAMLPSGNVVWQNRLNSTNSYFFENTDGIFTNYWWGSTVPPGSAAQAQSVGRSPFDVYSGVDMWPGRTAQPAFNDYRWPDYLVTPDSAITSMALFATNFTYNYGAYSNFNNDASDVQRFYSTEIKIFSGEDEDPFQVDTRWKGLANYIPVRSTITSSPFSTDFSTGHGHNYYADGTILRSGDWHNMSHQSTLPSWTFNRGGLDTIEYRFDDAYNGGNCLYVMSDSAGQYSLPLFSAAIDTEFDFSGVELAIKSATPSAIDSITVTFSGSNGKSTISRLRLNSSTLWETLSNSMINTGDLDTVTSIGININVNAAFELKIGQITWEEGQEFGTDKFSFSNPSALVYPNPSNGQVTFDLDENFKHGGNLKIFNIEGKLVLETKVKEGKQVCELPKGIFLYELSSNEHFRSGKILVR